MDPLKLVATLVYAALAYGCLRAYQHDRKVPIARSFARIWVLLSGLLCLLCLQNLTGIDANIAQAMRASARAEGWYATRRPMQVMLTLAVVLTGMAGAITLGTWVRPYAKRYGLAVAALCFLAAFTAAQTISLHQVDSLLNAPALFLPLRAWCHLAGVSLAAGALLAWRARVQGTWKG